MDLLQLQYFENSLNKFLAENIEIKDMIDVGAHIGTSLKYFLVNNFNVYAFEPVEQNRNKLLERNRNFRKLFVFADVLSDTSEYKDFYLANNADDSIHEYYHSLEKIPIDDYHKKGKVVRVKTTSLNELVLQGKIPKKVGFLKIDTEGHDLKVLEGASNLECEVICVEYWSENHPLGKSPSPPNKMISLLKDRDFKNFIIIKHERDVIHFYTDPLSFNDDSWGNILFFKESKVDLYNSALEFCRTISDSKNTGSLKNILGEILPKDFTFVDVGAHIGAFTKSIIELSSSAKGFLFEPTPQSFYLLKQMFCDNPHITVIESALDEKRGEKRFFSSTDSAQNSFYECQSNLSDVKEFLVKTDTIDDWLKLANDSAVVDLIKIDTQGNDLNVLKGGIETIKKHKPLILSEFIFVPLYLNQGDYNEQMMFLAKLGYKLAGIYNTHFTDSGCLAFADLLFLPSDKYEKLAGNISPFSDFICADHQSLLVENKNLRSVCSERLSLINRLSEEAEKRLNIITSLNDEIERLKGKK